MNKQVEAKEAVAAEKKREGREVGRRDLRQSDRVHVKAGFKTSELWELFWSRIDTRLPGESRNLPGDGDMAAGGEE